MIIFLSSTKKHGPSPQTTPAPFSVTPQQVKRYSEMKINLILCPNNMTVLYFVT